MSIITARIDGAPAVERNGQRYNGILIAVGASVVLWSGIGAGVWGIVSLFS